MTHTYDNQAMNFFVNRAMGIGNSGVEHAQFYRAKLFDQEKIPYRFLFVQLIKELHPAMDEWNLSNSQVISMYEYFVLGQDYLYNGVEKFYEPDIRTIIDGTNTTRVIETLTASGMRVLETAVKYESRKKKGLLMVSVSRVEIFNETTGEKKVAFDFYDTQKGETKIRNIHLFAQDGEHVFFWNEIQMQRFFFKKVNEAYNGSNNWFLDRGEESEVALFYPKDEESRILEIVHADHLSNRDDTRYPLWNNYYEYALTHISKIDRIVSGTTKQTEDFLIDFPGQEDKFVTIPVGGISDHNLKRVNIDNSVLPLRLITASRLAGEKHVDIAVRAVALMHDNGYPITLDIYGSGGEEGHIRDTIVTAAAEKYITLKGHSNNLSDIYGNYNAFISASWSEGFGLTTIEALNAGLPVIAHDARFGSIEMIQDGINGFLQPFKPGDQHLNFNVNSLTVGIERLLSSDYKQLRQATRKSMEKFKDSVIAAKWKELINELRNS